VQTETFVIFLGNKIKFFSAVLIFGSRSMVALPTELTRFTWWTPEPNNA